MKHFFTLLLGAITLQASAQTAPTWTWATSLQAVPAVSIAPSLAVDAVGNTYVAGGFSQTIALNGGTTLTSQGGQDGFVAKYDPAGNLLWSRQLKGTGNEYFQKLVADPSGGVTLVGLAGDGTQLSTSTFNTSNFSSSLILAQLDAQGQVQSLREIGAGSLLLPASIARDAAGSYYVSGSFALNATFGSITLTTPIEGASYGIDQFVVKVSAAGTPLWAQQGGRTFPAPAVPTAFFFNHLVVESGGNVYLTWTCGPTAGGFGSLAMPAGKGDYDGLVVKFDAQGTPLWAQRLGGAGADATAYASLDAGGRLAVPGLSAPTGSFGSSTTPPITIVTTGFVSVLEPTAGALVWSRELQATSAAAFRAVTADAAGNLYVAGHFAGQAALSGTTVPGASGLDALVASYSANGTLRWTQKSSGTGDEIPFSIAFDGTNRLVISGLLNGNGQFGSAATSTIVSASPNLGSPFIAQLGSVITATRAGQVAAPLALYPNPATAATAVSLPKLPTGTQLTLIDGLGRVTRRAAASPSLPLAGLAPGLYVVQAIAPNGEQWASRLTVE
jgi:hypothetical protein